MTETNNYLRDSQCRISRARLNYVSGLGTALSLCECVQRMVEDGRRFKPSDIGRRIYWYTPGVFGHSSPPYKPIPVHPSPIVMPEAQS